MTELRRSKYWAVDENNDGEVDAAGIQGFVDANFPLQPGDPANVMTRGSFYVGSDGAGGGIFQDALDARQYFLSDTTQLGFDDLFPEPVDDEYSPPPPDGGEDPVLPVISIAPAIAEQDEGNEGNTAFTFAVTRSGEDLSAPTTVQVNHFEGDTDADDYGGELPGVQQLEFAAGETEKTVTYYVSGDTDIELNEGFEAGITFANNAEFDPAANIADGTILNDDIGDFTIIEGTDRSDNLLGTDGDDFIRGFDREDVIQGAAGNDILMGDDGSDVLLGNAGNDILIGGDGEDILRGQEGNDILTGGERSDVFQFSGDFGNDIITDFDELQDGFFFDDADAEDIETEVVANGTLFTVESEETSGTVLLLGITDIDEFNI